MKQDALKNIKAHAFDWVFKGLIGIVVFQQKEMQQDIKELMRAVPGLQAKVDMLTDQRLIDRFKIMHVPPGKEEDLITYDSLTKKNP